MVQTVPNSVLAPHLSIRVCLGGFFRLTVPVYVANYIGVFNILNWAFGSPRELGFCKWRNTLARTKCGEAEAIAGWDTLNNRADTVVRTTALTFKIYLLMKRNVMANGLDRRN